MDENLASFDTELFIEEVKNRRAIWDMESADYKNRVLKRAAWQQLVDMFSTDGTSKEDLKILGTVLQKRWKSLRDNFVRELRKRKTTKSGSGATNSTPYMYFTRLQFLSNSVSSKRTICSLEDPVQLVEEGADNEDLNTPELMTDTPVSTKKIKLNPVDKHFADILNKSILLGEQREIDKNNEDEDKLFCLSLYKELKKVPEHGRLRTKIQLLETIQRAQEFSRINEPHHLTTHSQRQHNHPLPNIVYSQGPFSSQHFQPRLSPVPSTAGNYTLQQNQPMSNVLYGQVHAGATSHSSQPPHQQIVTLLNKVPK